MKKQIFTLIQTCLLVLTLGFWQTSQAQTPFTITWTGLGGAGTTNATGVPTGITIIQQYNGVTGTCTTTPSNGSTPYSGIIQAAAGYNVTITSIGGSGYGSSAGYKKFTLQLTNGSVYTQTNFSTVSSSSSCSGNTALNAFSVPTAGQLLTAGNQATVTLLRGQAGTETGGGYSYTRTLTITGVVTPVCNAPTGLSASNLTSSTADLSWNTVSGSSGYQYVVDQTSANPAGAGTAIAGTTYNATGLNPSTTYYLHVRNNCGGSNFSSWVTLPFTTTAAAICATPTNLAENNVTATSSDFNWDAMGSNDFEYVLDQISTNPAGAGTAINGVSYSTSSLNPSTTYYFHLRQNCGGTFSNWVLVNFTTPAAPCIAPTGLSAANTTYNSSDLSWNTQGSNSFEYVVDQLSSNPATAGTPTAGTTYNATGLNPLTTYYLHVRTDCGSGNFSPWTTLSFTTLIEPCNAPTGLASTNTTYNSSDLSWNSQGSSTYEYVVDQIAADPATAGTSTSGTTYNAAGLNPLTTYYLHVRTNCVQGNTSTWSTISFTTLIEPCNAPTGLASINTTHNSSDLSWNAQGSSTYEYIVDQIAADPATAGTSTPGTTYNAAGLNPLTTYYLHVRTNCVQGNTSTWSTISFTTLIEPCNTPTGLASTNTTYNSSDLSWNAQGSSTYEYVVDQVSTNPTAGTSTSGTTYNAVGLNPLTTYYLHVRTNCVQGNTSAWTTISFTTLIEPCNAPTGLTAANTTHNSSDLSWNAQGSSTYEYVVDQVPTDPATAGTLTAGTTYNATSLTPFTTYYLHVRTNCVQGNTSSWTTISFMTLVQPCAIPTGLAAANTTYNASDISWNTQGGNTFEYVLDQTATDPLSFGTPTTQTSYNPTTLNPLTTYYFHLRTDCSGTNFSSWTTISFTTPIEPCNAPTGLTAANITDSSSHLSWNTQGSSTYEYMVDQVSTNPTAGTSTTDTSYDVTGLDAATTYYLHVRTNCAQGNTSSWTTIPFTTLPEPCAVPTGLAVANTTDNSSDISWDIQGGNSFEYVLNQTAASPVSVGTSTSATSYHASAMNASTSYYMHVRTNCGNGNFSDWTTVSFTTAVAPCAAPTGLTASNVAGHTANLNWTAQTGNTFEYVLNQTSTNPTASGTVTTNNSFAATALNGSTTYYFHVRTNCGNGNFSNWTTVSFTTSSTVGLNEQEIIDLSVYPNPANNQVTIAGQTEGIITLINLKGQVLTSIKLENQNTIDFSAYESGFYFIKYVWGDKTANIKVIKQ